MIFIDSCFFIAIADKKDQWHTNAKKLMPTLNDKIVISDYIISEVLTEIGKRSGGKNAHQLFYFFIDNCRIIYVDSELLLDGELLFLKYDGTLSLADSVSVKIMQKMNITDIISFDSDFDKIADINRIS